MKKMHQYAVVTDLCILLKQQGFNNVEARHFNAIIKAANILCDEFNRESVRATPDMGLASWLKSDDTGLSSLYMAHVCANGPRAEIACPIDPDDFGRCYRFLEAVPEARENLHKLKESCGVWAGYIEHWEEMEQIYIEESPSGCAPKLYALMSEIREGGGV